MTSIALLALLLAGPSVRTPTDVPALRARIEPMLGTIDRPVEPERWRRLPPDARGILEAIAADPAELPSRRAAAISGLTALGGDGALHRRLADDASAPYLVRARALRGLATLLPGAARGATLGRLLRDDADPRIRAAAAEALAHASPAEGCTAVRAQAQREGADARFAWARALSTCEGK